MSYSPGTRPQSWRVKPTCLEMALFAPAASGGGLALKLVCPAKATWRQGLSKSGWDGHSMGKELLFSLTHPRQPGELRTIGVAAAGVRGPL